MAVRRVIDVGFSGGEQQLANSYFILLIGVVAVLALASSARFYLVMTLGERVVADLRADVFRASDAARAGLLRFEPGGRARLAAHRRHHADQVDLRLDGLDRAAQRHHGRSARSALMVVDEPAALGHRHRRRSR